jgi:hypothetical protein
LGSTPAREAELRKYLNCALVGVFIIYILIVLIAFFGKQGRLEHFQDLLNHENALDS